MQGPSLRIGDLDGKKVIICGKQIWDAKDVALKIAGLRKAANDLEEMLKKITPPPPSKDPGTGEKKKEPKDGKPPTG